MNKLESIVKAKDLLEKAWTEIYKVDKGYEGDLHEIRIAINNVELMCFEAKQKLEKSGNTENE